MKKSKDEIVKRRAVLSLSPWQKREEIKILKEIDKLAVIRTIAAICSVLLQAAILLHLFEVI